MRAEPRRAGSSGDRRAPPPKKNSLRFGKARLWHGRLGYPATTHAGRRRYQQGQAPSRATSSTPTSRLGVMVRVRRVLERARARARSAGAAGAVQLRASSTPFVFALKACARGGRGRVLVCFGVGWWCQKAPGCEPGVGARGETAAAPARGQRLGIPPVPATTPKWGGAGLKRERCTRLPPSHTLWWGGQGGCRDGSARAASGWLVVRRVVPPLPPPGGPDAWGRDGGGWWQRLLGSRVCDPRSATGGWRSSSVSSVKTRSVGSVKSREGTRKNSVASRHGTARAAVSRRSGR